MRAARNVMPLTPVPRCGFRDTVSALLKRFRLREECKPEAAE
jgi:fructose 1,6-bisphosphate aldolase/phosphatase